MYSTACAHTRRLKPDFKIDKVKAAEISSNFRVLPLYETPLFEDVYRKHYSLGTHEYLRCRWDVFRDSYATRVVAPFQFFSNRDVHFYQGSCRFIPSQSFHKKTDFRLKLKQGPGVDSFGQMPIPEELQARKFRSLARKYPKRYPKQDEEEEKKK